jgi:hypothetical protein
MAPVKKFFSHAPNLVVGLQAKSNVGAFRRKEMNNWCPLGRRLASSFIQSLGVN